MHTFPKGICLKVNVVARLEFERAYYDSTVQRFKPLNHEDTPYLRWLVIYLNFCLDVAQGHMNGSPDENWTDSRKFASLAW